MNQFCKVILTGFIVSLSFSGCVRHQKSVPQKLSEQPFNHLIKNEGETISIISKWYTGDVKNWELVAQANPALNPSQITIGDSIVIPVHLVKTREEMPKSFLDEQLQLLSAVRKAEPTPEEDSKAIAPNPSAIAEGSKEVSPATQELIETRDELWKELMGE